jgi:branched-chain amino acid transport system permease protein
MRAWWTSAATLAAIAAALAAAGFFGSRPTILLATEFCSVLAIALMWNVLAGYAGIVLIGMPLFIGVGGYALYLSANAIGAAPYPMVLAGALASGLVALAVAPVLFRLSGAQLAIGSWVLSEIARILVLQSKALGAGGGVNLEVMKLVPRSERLMLNFACSATVLMIALVTVVVAMRGRFGLGLRAMRDSEAAAEAMGVDIGRVRLQALVICAAVSGAAGGSYYISNLQITPDSAFSVNWMAIIIFITVLGGIGTVEGPIIGALVYFALRETLSGLGSVYFIIVGLIAIGVTIGSPAGLWGLVRRGIGFDLLPVVQTPPARRQPGGLQDETKPLLTTRGPTDIRRRHST